MLGPGCPLGAPGFEVVGDTVAWGAGAGPTVSLILGAGRAPSGLICLSRAVSSDESEA